LITILNNGLTKFLKSIAKDYNLDPKEKEEYLKWFYENVAK
tara:strand:+ start:1581 stop:1703 length:123 start_codon:yes stop_codon:yes gene_type:complete